MPPPAGPIIAVCSPPLPPCGNRKAYEGARAPRGWVAGSSTSRESLGERFVCPAPVTPSSSAALRSSSSNEGCIRNAKLLRPRSLTPLLHFALSSPAKCRVLLALAAFFSLNWLILYKYSREATKLLIFPHLKTGENRGQVKRFSSPARNDVSDLSFLVVEAWENP
jgi:hypothetical protein